MGGTLNTTVPTGENTAVQEPNGGNAAENQQNQEPNGGNAADKQPSEPVKAFTQTDIDNAIAEAQKKWKADADEALRLSKLSEEERQRAEFDKKVKQYEADKAELQRQRLQYETAKQLQNRHLPEEFAAQLTGADAEATLKNVTAFKTSFDAAVEQAVQQRLAGKTPKGGGSGANGKDGMAAVIAAAVKQGF